DRLQLAPPLHATAQLEQILERNAERELEIGGLLDVSGDGKDHRTGRVLRTELYEPLPALAQDARHRGQALGVVDRRRRTVQTKVGRERRLEARLAGLALERVQHRCLLAADVRARADKRVDVEVDPAASDVFAEEPCCIGLLQRRLEPRNRLTEEFTPDVVV